MARLLYVVWCDLDPRVEDDWRSWMEKVHIPEVVAAGGFIGAKLYNSIEGGVARHATVYEAKDRQTLEAYLSGSARQLREDYLKHFGAKSRLTRMVLEETFST